MGTQFQRLTASRAWSPEAVQADSARHLEAHHVVSQARLQLPRGLRRPPRPWEEQHVWPWQPKRDPDRHRLLCPQLSPSGRPLPCCGFSAWNLLGHNPNPNPTPNRDPPPKPKLDSIPNPAFEVPSGMGPHFRFRGRSRDRSRFGPGNVPGPISNPSACSVPMGTQFQRLKTPRAWGPEAVQPLAAWNLEAHHVISQAHLQLP